LYQLSDFWEQKTRRNAAILLRCFRKPSFREVDPVFVWSAQRYTQCVLSSAWVGRRELASM
jgi:hypothetical protein